jgi:transposase-like protein
MNQNQTAEESTTVTEESMALIELAEKHAGDDFLRELGQFTLQRLMEAETEQRCGAGRHERSEQRVNQRNGYRERSVETRIGRLDLKIPKLRSGSYYPSFLEPRKGSERALVAVVQEAYVKGISTRKVDDLVQAMGMSGISKSQVSRLCKDIDQRVTRFLERPLDGKWPHVWLDATYLKSREEGHDLLVHPLDRVGARDLRPVLLRERHERFVFTFGTLPGSDRGPAIGRVSIRRWGLQSAPAYRSKDSPCLSVG